MSPEVEAALIAGVVSLISLGGTGLVREALTRAEPALRKVPAWLAR
jgi:hypothetical protein